MGIFILCLSISLQLLAAFLAARQLRLSGTPLAWLCISVALVLMTIRRGITLFMVITGDVTLTPDLMPELVALVISVLMVVGVVFMVRHFQEILHSKEVLEQEITRRRDVEEVLRQSEARFDQVAESAGEWIWEVDAEGLYRYCSSAVEKILGYSPDELVGQKHFYDLFVPEEREDLKEVTLAAFERRETFRAFVNNNVHKNGEIIVLETSGTPVLDKDGNLLGYLGADMDITGRKKAEQALQEREELYRTLVETTNTGYVILDEQGRVMDANSEYVRLTGRNNIDEIRGRSVLEWTAEHDKQRNAHEVARCLREGFVQNLEIDYVDREGVPVSIEINATVIKGSEDIRIITLCRGIIDRKKSETMIAAQRDLGIALSGVSALEEAFDICIKTAMEISGMEAAGIYMANDDASMDLIAHRGLPEKFLKKVKHFFMESPEAEITQKGVPVYFCRSLPEMSPSVVQALHDEGFRASAVIPISHQGRVVCSLHLCSRKFDEVPQDNKNALEAIASWTGGTFVRIQSEQRLKESKEKFRRLYETMNEAWASIDMTGRIIETNYAYESMLGYSEEELSKLTHADLTPGRWHSFEARIVEEQILVKGFSDVYEKEYRKKDGTVFPVELRMSLVRDQAGAPQAMWAIVRDIEERKLAEESTRESLQEKEALLREIHHRVKNNLAVTISLLRLQSRQAKDEHHRRMFIESQERIRSMALAHEKLYQSENLSAINSKDYLTSLAQHLMSALGQIGCKIELQRQIAEVYLDLETGITLGLIVTELMSNSLKHGFPDGRAGTIALTLKEIDDSTLELSVADDGVGLAENIQLNKPNTLGLDLVRIFARQLRGQLEVRRDLGTESLLRFHRSHDGGIDE